MNILRRIGTPERPASSRLTRLAFWTLAGLNAVLAGGLIVPWLLDTPVTAQAQPPLRPGEYLLVPGEAVGAPVDVVYVLDTINGIVGGIAPDNNDRMVGMAPINLQQVFDAARVQQPAGATRR